MAVSRTIREELMRFWAAKGVALCAEAQADGVPCTALGRSCETCALAVEHLLEAKKVLRQLSDATGDPYAMPECGP